MKKLFPYLLPLGAVAAPIASVSLSNDLREQAVFLERVATKIEHAQRIPPATERSVREMLRSMHRHAPKPASEFANRQDLAIQRIEAALIRHTATVQPKKTPAVSPKDASAVRQEEASVARQEGVTTTRADEATTLRRKNPASPKEASH